LTISVHPAAWRTSLLYGLAGLAWIAVSDVVLDRWVTDPRQHTTLSVYKGAAFVVVTAALLYLALRRHLLRVEREAGRRAAAETARAASDLRFRRYVEHAPAAILVTDAKSRLVDVNPMALRMFGYDTAQFLRLSIADLVHPDERPLARTEFSALKAEGERTTEIRLVDARQRSFWAEVVAVALDDGHYMAWCHDITERRRAERENARATRAYALLSAANAAAARALCREGLLAGICRIAANEPAFGLVWIGQRDAEANRVVPVAHAGAAGSYLDAVTFALDADAAVAAPPVVAVREGHIARWTPGEGPGRQTPAWVEVGRGAGLGAIAAFPLTLNGGTWGCLVVHFVADESADAATLDLLADTASSVSFALTGLEQEAARRNAERALQASEQRLQMVVERMPVGVFMHIEGRIVYANPQALRMFGAPSLDVLLDTSALDRVHRDDHAAARERMVQVLEHHRSQAARESRFLTLDGEVFDVEVNGEPLVQGDRSGAMVFFRDVGDHKRLEAQFRQAQKMEAIGTLAGGVAHDFNNLLTVIRSNASLLTDDTYDGPEARDMAREILEASDRASALTRQLLLFSRRQAMQLRELDLGEVVGNLSKMLRRILGEDVTFTVEQSARLPAIQGDVGMVEQILLNLAVNARDAMPNGGRLTLRTRTSAVGACVCNENPKAHGRDCVVLEVADTGTGIPPDVLPHIFEPFFTTKPQGKGTGLGLATVYGIVDQHGGWITVDTAPDRGTTFTLCFPVAHSGLSREPTDAVVQDRPVGTETLLLVEDDSAVRRTVTAVLMRCGYAVFPAASAAEALEIWARHKDEIRLLLTDVVLPDEMDGVALAARLLADRPRLPVLYSSGYATRAAERLELVEGDNLLSKPYDSGTLARTIRRCLDRPAQ
jgi:PAS domain S-box-containing protein